MNGKKPRFHLIKYPKSGDTIILDAGDSHESSAAKCATFCGRLGLPTSLHPVRPNGGSRPCPA